MEQGECKYVPRDIKYSGKIRCHPLESQHSTLPEAVREAIRRDLGLPVERKDLGCRIPLGL